MNESDNRAFAALFKDAYFKCFGEALKEPMTETESKLFCNKVLERTGLSIGWKSVKNYSFYILDNKSAKAENPSVATLDTLSRYVMDAPRTTEIDRKNNESHHPYWYLYKGKPKHSSLLNATNWRSVTLFALGILVMAVVFVVWLQVRPVNSTVFSDNFLHLSDDALAKNDWLVIDKDSVYWNKRDANTGQLTLYTLKGDNWPDPANKQGIKNLLLRRIPDDCFTVEVHFNNFIPQQEWQQAGILLLEDTTLKGKSIRLSLAFNDFFGGFPRPKEILVQAITSEGNGFSKPEEVAHKTIAYADSIKLNPIQMQMLQHGALRIEKRGNKFRYLYSGGIADNTAFKEVANQEFNMYPRYIGIFAIKGFKDSTTTIPVHFTFFRIAGSPCE
jgi:hypothetical protein